MRADSAQGRWKSFQMAWLARLTASALGAGKTEQKSEKGSERRKKTKKNNKKTHFILPEQNLIENCEKHTETQNHTFYKHSATNTFFFFSSAWCWWSWVWSQCPIQVLIRERCVTRCLWTVTRQTHKKTLYKYNVGMRDIDFFQPIPIITYFSRPMLIRLSISFTFVNCKKKFDTCSLHTPEGKKGSDIVR